MIFRAVLMAFILAIFACPAFAAKALIFSDCTKYEEEWGCKEQNLMVYKFTNGVVSKEEYSRFMLDDKSPAVFDGYFDPSEIVQNRYLIIGERIYDLKERKVIHDGYQYEHMRSGEGEDVYYTGRRVKILDDQIVYAAGESGTDIYIYDLNKHTYGKATAEQEKHFKHWALWGVFSPDFQKTLTTEQHDSGFRLVLNTAEETKVLADGLQTESSPDDFPHTWLNNDTAVTQRSDGEIVTVDLSGKITPLVKIYLNPGDNRFGYAWLTREDDGLIVYTYGDSQYRINPKTKTFAEVRGNLPATSVNLEYDFEAQFFQPDQEGKPHKSKILYKGTIIGPYRYSEAKTSDGHIALEYYSGDNSADAQQRVAVWSADSGQWTEINVEWMQCFIGWVDLE
ncbi:MAG: hypothetical protein IPH06_03830 [Alphaproteobacteria bacterium]|nr:hypothetical protein [Alphaproteobacteria bacterium]QQS57166.1 MAG: hypothetical protein IPN28_13145 [Alphaproteobacteria bacterium]